MTKNHYNTPSLTLYGDIEEITQVDGTLQPTDVPKGQPGGAFS
jgi:hypothetical protein